jgi:FKBP-type peptidyl-prolyl cis-trans isomerase
MTPMRGRLIVPTVKTLLKLLLAAGALALAVPAVHAQREKLPPEDLDFVEKNWPEAKKTSTGLRYIVLKEGEGTEMPKAGTKVAVVYVGRLLNGKIFNQLDDRTKPFVFRVRRGEVIEGWEQILQQMKQGEKRMVIIPGELAYGTRGRPPDIPRNATLVFDIELMEIRKD